VITSTENNINDMCLTMRFGGSGVCGQGTEAKIDESARRADFSLSSGLSSIFLFASLCSFFWGGGIPATKYSSVDQGHRGLMHQDQLGRNVREGD